MRWNSQSRSQNSGTIATLFLVLAFGLAATAATTEEPAAKDSQRVLVLDGAFVHDVGQLHLNVTNFGLIGSWPGTSTFPSDVPSAEWPAGSGVEHLFASGLWVGAMVDGVARVSTGQFAAELLPDPDDPLDTIWRQQPSQSGSNRYPELLADDDGDGLEDEDPINGRDDDLDGLIDEDAAGIADQHFRATMRDDEQLAIDQFPNHVPLGISIVQESFQWNEATADDFVGMRFTIKNEGANTLENVYLAFFADCDVGELGFGYAEDDLPLFISTTRVAPDGTVAKVEIGGIYDADGDGGIAPGALGVQILGHPVDSSGISAPDHVGMSGFKILAGAAPFPDGGDPTNDAERYALISDQGFDPTPPLFFESEANDWRIVVSVGPFASVAPGEELFLDLALVAGEVTEGLIDNAATAWLTHRGQRFDRDGDPSTGPGGLEFEVNWLRTAETPVSLVPNDDQPLVPRVFDFEISAAPNPFNPRVAIKWTQPRSGSPRLRILDARGRLVRRMDLGSRVAGPHEAIWDGRDASGQSVASGVFHAEVELEGRRRTVRLILVR